MIWYSIETAPRDGSVILLWRSAKQGVHHIFSGYWYVNRWIGPAVPSQQTRLLYWAEYPSSPDSGEHNDE